MELAILVWAISILKPITIILVALAVIAVVVLFFAFMNSTDYGSYKLPDKFVYKWSGLALLFAAIAAVIPNEKTAYVMVGAYATQQIAENPKVQELSGKVLKVIEQKLDNYIEEATTNKNDGAKHTQK